MPDRIGELASMTGYSPEEADFQFGVRATPWFGEFAQQHGEPNLNDPNYDYRAAWAAGARPNVRDPGDNQYHWPSQFKGPEHPNRFVNGVDTITGQPVSTGEEYAGLGGDPSHLANTIKNWWTSQPSWLSRAQAENQKTSEAFQRGGMGEIAKQLATDTTEPQELYGAFGVGNIKGVRPPVAPGALAATSEYRPPFYSAVEQAVQGAKQNAAPGQQWAGYLRNQPGVKPEEVEALKLGKLFEQPGSVPKEAVLGEIAANKVNVGEVVKGAPQHSQEMQKFLTEQQNSNIAPRPVPTTPDQWQTLSDRLMWMGQNRQPLGDTAGAQRFFSLAEEAGRHAEGVNPSTGSTAGMPKFSQYTLPGGENYREMLLTLPEGGPVINRMKDIQRRLGEINELPAAVHQGPEGPKILAEFDALQSEKARLRHEIPPTFKSGHYDEPNILAHVRYNDRVIDGKKTLFVEEVQSDWHQKGKREGYTQPPDQDAIKAANDRVAQLRSAIDQKFYEMRKDNPNLTMHQASLNSPEIDALSRQFVEADNARHALERKPQLGVPDAPFKTTWPELAMKRIIREAAEKGYDKVAWTPGSVQAERYDLSKHVDSITVVPAGDVGSGTKRWNMKTPSGSFTGAIVTDKNGAITNAAAEWGDVRGKHISDVIGKDVAEKGLKAEKETKLEGIDLRVGGEGMKGFYDEILPATVNRLVKKHGGRVMPGEMQGHQFKGYKSFDVGEGPIGGPALYGVTPNGNRVLVEQNFIDGTKAWERADFLNAGGDKRAVHTLDITPSLRAAAMKGFPLFSAGGVAATGAIGELARQDEYR